MPFAGVNDEPRYRGEKPRPHDARIEFEVGIFAAILELGAFFFPRQWRKPSTQLARPSPGAPPKTLRTGTPRPAARY